MNYTGLKITNKSDKTLEIDVEGYIGFDPYDSPANQIATKEKMKAELKKLAGLKAETIIVNINSYGGDVNHGISIHDLLAESSAHIITKINGMTASAATIIAMAGSERKMSDNALFLVHDASMITWGNKNDMKEALGALETIDGRLLNIYTKATGKSEKEITDLMEENNGNGKWITAQEAKDYGFITDVFEPMHAAAHFSNDLLQRVGLPPVPEGYQQETDPSDLAGSIAGQVFTKIKDLLTPGSSKDKKQENNNKPNTEKMADKLTRIVAAAKLGEDFEIQDGKIVMTEAQAQGIEDLLASQAATIEAYSGLEEGETVATLKQSVTDLTADKTKLEGQVKDKDTEIEKLSKNTVKETGANAEKDPDQDEAPVDEEAEHFYNLSKVK